MKCTKCNHELPEDSEFCQYCGSRVERSITDLSGAKAGSTVEASLPTTAEETITDQLPDFGNMTPDEVLAAILQIQAKNTVDAMVANEQSRSTNEADEDFGLVPENPIFTLAIKSIEGEKEYLGRLYTLGGEKIKYSRRGSTCTDGVNGMIDIYDTYLPSGQLYKTIYINMYGAKSSVRAPAGFTFDSTQKKTCPKCGRILPKDSEFCQFCGERVSVKSVPTSETSQTTPRKTPLKGGKQQIVSVVLVILLVISLATNIAQLIYHSNSIAAIQVQLDEAKRTIANKDVTLAMYERKINSQDREIEELRSKSDYFDEIVRKMRYGNAGYAASNFFASDSVIVVKKGSTYTFSLTANWPSGGTVDVEYSSDCAWVSFDDNEWYKSTNITVHPKYDGVTVVKFSNNVDEKTFKVLIIVNG